MKAPFVATTAVRQLSLCLLLMAVCTASRSEETGDEEKDSPYSHTEETSALAEALDPLPPSKHKPPTRPPQQPPTRAPDLKTTPTRVSTKAPTIHITDRHTPSSQFDRAQKALLQGSTSAAKEAYEAILKNDPRNTDALLGLALIHLRNGDNALAEALIYRTLTISPRDGLALALLSPLRATENISQEESRLQQGLADQPDAAPLHFALGNLYARQNRWREAQQAYFKATIGDRDHPDYLFNLAVSLERIKQHQAAKQYYQAALAAADLRPVAFSRTLVTHRVDNMERSSP